MSFKKYGDERSSPDKKVAETLPEDNEQETYHSARKIVGSEEEGFSVGNQDPDKRGRKIPPQDRETDQEVEDQRRRQRGSVGYGEVTRKDQDSWDFLDEGND